MATDFLSASSILQDLQDIYLRALEKGNFSVALKAKELLGRELGLFRLNKKKISIDDFSEEDLAHLIETIEEKLRLDPGACEG